MPDEASRSEKDRISSLEHEVETLQRHVADSAGQYENLSRGVYEDIAKIADQLDALARVIDKLAGQVLQIEHKVESFHPSPKQGNCPKCSGLAARPGVCNRCGHRWAP